MATREIQGTRAKRSDFVNFIQIGEAAGGKYSRMQGFTESGKSLNAVEANDQYVDEDSERTTVTGYAKEISFALNYFHDNPVHEAIKAIFDDEKTGDDAVCEIVTVNTKTKDAYKQKFTVMPDSEGEDVEAYGLTGSFKANGESVKGTVTTDDDFMTVTFTEGSDAEETSLYSGEV